MRWQAVFGCSDYLESTGCAGARDRARVDRPRWLRILIIAGGSSMAALRRSLRTGDDLQGAAAVAAMFDVDVEDPFEQPGPAHARRFSLGRDVIGWWLGGALCRSGNDFTAQLGVGRQHAMGVLLNWSARVDRSPLRALRFRLRSFAFRGFQADSIQHTADDHRHRHQ